MDKFHKLADDSLDVFARTTSVAAKELEQRSQPCVAGQRAPVAFSRDPHAFTSASAAGSSASAASALHSSTEEAAERPAPVTPPWKKHKWEVPPPSYTRHPKAPSPLLPPVKSVLPTDAIPPHLRSNKYTAEQLIDLRAESSVAKELGLTWQERGPPPTGEAGELWRGQRYREGSQRWGNRGGKSRWWYEQYYKAKRNGTVKEFLEKHPSPHGDA